MLKLSIVVGLVLVLVLIWVGNNWLEVSHLSIRLVGEGPVGDGPVGDGPVGDGTVGEGGEGTELGASGTEKPRGLRILQVSDLHGKPYGFSARRLLRRIDELDYDIIAITGDFITRSPLPHGLRPALRLAKGLVSRAPVYFVTGNHEAGSPQFERLEAGLADLGVVVLRGGVVETQVRGRDYVLLGLDDLEFFGGDMVSYTEALIELFESAPSSGPRVLLSHRPGIFETYVRRDVDLVLTGHVHGGLIRIPGVGGVVSPDQGFFPKYDAGLFRRDGTSMVISRGLGPTILPIRVLNRPELVVVELAPREHPSPAQPNPTQPKLTSVPTMGIRWAEKNEQKKRQKTVRGIFDAVYYQSAASRIRCVSIRSGGRHALAGIAGRTRWPPSSLALSGLILKISQHTCAGKTMR